MFDQCIGLIPIFPTTVSTLIEWIYSVLLTEAHPKTKGRHELGIQQGLSHSEAWAAAPHLRRATEFGRPATGGRRLVVVGDPPARQGALEGEQSGDSSRLLGGRRQGAAVRRTTPAGWPDGDEGQGGAGLGLSGAPLCLADGL